MKLSQTRLQELLHYNPETGIWTWLNPPNHNTRLRGKPAGSRRCDGYLKIRIGGTSYYSSHLACLYMTGKFPDEEMDHIDRDSSNDRWNNLREATSSQNKWNRDEGIRGVYTCGNRWWAQAGRGAYLGTFATFEEAVIARDAAASQIAGEFAVLNQTESTS